jgi:hypothetical protein
MHPESASVSEMKFENQMPDMRLIMLTPADSINYFSLSASLSFSVPGIESRVDMGG